MKIMKRHLRRGQPGALARVEGFGSGTGTGGAGTGGASGGVGVVGTGGAPFRLVPLVAFVGLVAALAGCGGSSPPAAGGTSPAGNTAATALDATRHPAALQTGGAQARDACALVTAADLRSLGVTGPASPQKNARGPATVYGCTWGHPPGTVFHLQFEALDPAAASQVRVSLGGRGAVVPGVGDSARGEFGSVLVAVNFSKGNTFVAMELFGTGASGRKDAFLVVAKNVASRV